MSGAHPQETTAESPLQPEVRYAILTAGTEVLYLAALALVMPAIGRAARLGARPPGEAAAVVGALVVAGLLGYAVAIVPAVLYSRRCRGEQMVLPHVDFPGGGPVHAAAYMALVRGFANCTVLLAILAPYGAVPGPAWWLVAIAPCLLACALDVHPLHGSVGDRAAVPPDSTMPQEAVDLLRELADAQGLAEVRAVLAPVDLPDRRPLIGCVSRKKLAILLANEALLAALGPRELKVAFAHELAHHQSRDAAWSFRLRAGLRFLAAMGVCAVLAIWGPGPGRGFGAVLVAPSSLLWWYAFRLMGIPIQMAHSRWRQRKAHWRALRVTDDPKAFTSAARKLAGPPTAAAEPSLLDKLFFCDHPSLAETLAIGRRYAAGRGIPLDSGLSEQGPDTVS